MMDNRIPYDKAATIWSPDGELVQLSYARRATERGLPGVALILNEKEILLAARIKITARARITADFFIISSFLIETV